MKGIFAIFSCDVVAMILKVGGEWQTRHTYSPALAKILISKLQMFYIGICRISYPA